MEGKENNEKECVKKTKQQITVPFLWEEKPGAPKEDWQMPKREPLTPAVPQPVKYIASVPFKWEEKPGTPLRCFSQETKEHTAPETVPENRSLPLPPAFLAMYGNESDGESSDEDEYDEDWLSELDFEALSEQSEESSFCSGPSLVQEKNRATPDRVPVSSAVPLQNPFIQQNDGCMEGSCSPESCTSPTSYASRSASLRGASFLQQLFPLYPPKSGFLDKPVNSEKNVQVQYSTERKLPTAVEYKKLQAEFRRSGVIRRPLTLGELIMQSRRRSFRRKAVEMKIKNPPQDFNEDKPQGCFNLSANASGLTKLLGKDLLTLKLS